MESEIREDLKIIKADVSEIKVTLAVNTKSLETHMLRTEMSERRIEKLEYVLIGLLATAIGAAVIKAFIG